jgi:nicotinamidase-related amidase
MSGGRRAHQKRFTTLRCVFDCDALLATSRPVAPPRFRSNFPVESTVNPGEFSWSIGRGSAAITGNRMKEAFGIAVPQTLQDVCDRSRLALLVYDMQVGIVSQLKGADAVTARVARVLEASRRAGLRVFYTRHMSLPRELMGAFQYRMAMAWQRVDDPAKVEPWFLRDSPGFAIVPELKPRPSEAIFDKLAMSAFEGTPLEMALRDCGITAVAMIGIATEIGIEPTARHAADLGIIPVIVADACGAGHAEAAERSLESLKFAGDAIITDTDAFCAALKRR